MNNNNFLVVSTKGNPLSDKRMFHMRVPHPCCNAGRGLLQCPQSPGRRVRRPCPSGIFRFRRFHREVVALDCPEYSLCWRSKTWKKESEKIHQDVFYLWFFTNSLIFTIFFSFYQNIEI